MPKGVIKINCGHAFNVIDSNGITEHMVIFKVRSEMEMLYKWKDSGDSRGVEIQDDSGLHFSSANYRCIDITYDYGHAIIELEKEE